MVNSKELTALIKEAKGQGWRVEFTKSCHLRWSSPTGGFFFSSSTPSDHRAVQNIRRDLRLNGFLEIKKKKGKRQ